MPFKNPQDRISYDKARRVRLREQRGEYNKKYTLNNPRFQRDRHLKQTYGIGIEEVKQMFISQGGTCAICMDKFKSKRHMHVDHDHTTGKVRQLLCPRCNRGLGFFKDSDLLLQRAVEYVRKWK